MVSLPPPARPGDIAELRWLPLAAGAFVLLFAVAVTLALTMRGGGSGPGSAALYDSIGGEFVLTSHTGEEVALSDFRGDVVVIYFGYSFCPDVCPVHLTLLSAALDQQPARARNQIQPLFITIDPERDTPEALASYVPHFTDDLIGLTGTPEQIAEVAANYAVAYSRVDDPDFSEYLMNHSSIFYVIDRQGRIVDLIRPDLTPAQMARELQTHL